MYELFIGLRYLRGRAFLSVITLISVASVAVGVTVLLVEHHMDLVMGLSDVVSVLDYGDKIAEGPPEQVRANPRVVAAYLGEETEAP